MNRIYIALAVFGLLALTIPWWWIGSEPREGGGLPAWVLYAVAMNVVFAVVVSWLIRRCWRLFEGDDDAPVSRQ